MALRHDGSSLDDRHKRSYNRLIFYNQPDDYRSNVGM